MVKVNRRTRTPAGVFTSSAVAAVVLVSTIGMLAWYRNSLDISSLTNEVTSLTTMTTTFSSDENADQLKAWRKRIRETCAAAKSAADVLAIANINKIGFTMPSYKQEQPRDDRAIKSCRRVVMDFGANIGDTSGHVIDSGMIGCTRNDMKGADGKAVATLPVHFNVKTKQFEDTPKRNPLTQNLVRMMATFGATVGPEDYCYYGVEGNPVFTQRLRDIEDHVMAIRPRPIQHMHFFTESVGAGQDGMTKLYLDTVNTEQNFWGSSIFKDHQDVRKSAQENGNSTTIAADVMGYTIGTLMRKTLRAFAPDATPEEKKGNHLVLKVDIEGGEFPLLSQAVQDGTLCEFVKMGNQADLFIEFHSVRVTGKHDHVGQAKSMKDTLTKCGVNFRNLAAWWA